jgi:YidC/Oxa1 family membrane protein insertase
MSTQQSGTLDRTQVIGMILLGLIFAGYLGYSSYTAQKNATEAQRRNDSLKAAQAKAAKEHNTTNKPASADSLTGQSTADTPRATTASAKPADTLSAEPSRLSTNTAATRYGALFAPFAQGTPQLVTINTPLVKTQFNSRGAVLHSWHLMKFNSWFGKPAQLVPAANTKGQLGVRFTTHEGKEVDTRNLYFAVEYSKPATDGTITLAENDSLVITARMMLSGDAGIVKTMTFYGNRYDVNVKISMPGMDNVIANRRYEFSWYDGVQYQEENSVNESAIAKAIISQNGSIEELDAAEVGNTVQTSGSGIIDFAAIKAQYFMAGVKPRTLSGEASVYLDGTRTNAPQEGVMEHYNMHFRMPYSNAGTADIFTVYIGPLDYDIVKQYGMEACVDFGWRFLIRPIAEYIMLPFLKFVHTFIPNYGWAIIVFAIALRLLMQPLMASQMKTSQKMQLLAPEIEKIKQRFKDDPQRQQQETMALYGQYGINPAGGCLPLLLQMPIFFALSQTLQTITLRQQPFMLWIKDLSVPDVIVHLPFKVPLLNVDILSGLAIISSALMLVQSMTTVTDPNQKAAMYIMPIMFVFLFSGFASGVALYYSVFNVIGIVQQLYITKIAKNKLTLEDLKKMPKKEGWFQRKMREAQEIAAAQGRTLPGQGAARTVARNTSATPNTSKKKK